MSVTAQNAYFGGLSVLYSNSANFFIYLVNLLHAFVLLIYVRRPNAILIILLSQSYLTIKKFIYT